jgi:CheY-like chemotaxis protein
MKKILVVDDESDVRELIKAGLDKTKYTTLSAASGMEALGICKINKPDLILLDIAMPMMDGYQVCEKLKQDPQTKDIPVLFLTGKDLDPRGIIERYEHLGACGYIPKPSTLKELLEKIGEILQ